MQSIQKSACRYDGVKPFDFLIHHVKTDRRELNDGRDSHVHPECEIYINLSGDVSFMVEDRVYPILPGSIVITRPYEYHHCIYHSNALHEHFCMLFSAVGNEALFDRFFQRAAGEGNLLMLPANRQRELQELCHEMVECPATGAEQHYRFFRLIHLLNLADTPASDAKVYPEDVTQTMNYINQHFAEQISIGALAQQAHVSVNTLERHFADAFHLSPYAYLKKKRLAHAASVLWAGGSVMDACAQSGFADYSGFISLFKKTYGMTPLKYKSRITQAHGFEGV